MKMTVSSWHDKEPNNTNTKKIMNQWWIENESTEDQFNIKITKKRKLQKLNYSQQKYPQKDLFMIVVRILYVPQPRSHIKPLIYYTSHGLSRTCAVGGSCVLLLSSLAISRVRHTILFSLPAACLSSVDRLSVRHTRLYSLSTVSLFSLNKMSVRHTMFSPCLPVQFRQTECKAHFFVFPTNCLPV